MFADDFVGLTTNAEDLQKLINVVQGFCNKWRLKSNIKKSAVVVFSKVAITDMCAWKWGDKVIPRVVSYCYLGTEFAENGSWDSHVQKVIDNGKKKLNCLHRFVSNRNISTVARRLLLVSVLRPTLEYGSEVWTCNKRQTASLESNQLGAAKKILGCSSKTSTIKLLCNAIIYRTLPEHMYCTLTFIPCIITCTQLYLRLPNPSFRSFIPDQNLQIDLVLDHLATPC